MSWLFSFGYAHKYPNRYIVIEQEDQYEAREEMFRRYGQGWAFQYPDTPEQREELRKYNVLPLVMLQGDNDEKNS